MNQVPTGVGVTGPCRDTRAGSVPVTEGESAMVVRGGAVS